MLNEPNYVGDVVLFEEDDHYSRDVVTIVSGAGVLTVGTVLAKITASGKYTSAKATGADGSQTAIAVLLEDVDATSADVTKVKVLARHGTVKRLGLVFDASIDTANEKAAAEAQLAAVGILTRDSA